MKILENSYCLILEIPNIIYSSATRKTYFFTRIFAQEGVYNFEHAITLTPIVRDLTRPYYWISSLPFKKMLRSLSSPLLSCHKHTYHVYGTF